MEEVLVVYRCYDDHEEESCFVTDYDGAKNYLDSNPLPPAGFEDRPGYYFFETLTTPQ